MRNVGGAGVDVDYERRAVITALVSVIVVAVVIVIIFTAVRVYLMRRQTRAAVDDAANESSAAFLAGCDSLSAASRSTCSDLDGLKVDQLVSHGRYGDVYRGLLAGKEVAVKVMLLHLS